MSENLPEKEAETGLTRYGKTIYKTNPSITGKLPVKIKTKALKKASDAYMVAPGTGEVIGKGAFGFVEEYEVDESQFVKIYLEGVKQYGALSKAGMLLFEFVYREMSGLQGKDKDTVTLNYLLALDWRTGLNKRTYERGISELLEKGFLFRSMAADVYFININFLFNGSRVEVIKRYRVRRAKQHDENQLSLFDE